MIVSSSSLREEHERDESESAGASAGSTARSDVDHRFSQIAAASL